MAQRIQGIITRGAGIATLFLTILAAGLLGGHAAATRAEAQQPDRIGVVRSFFSALSNWDVDGQVAAFADNAVFIGAGRPVTARSRRLAPTLQPSGSKRREILPFIPATSSARFRSLERW